MKVCRILFISLLVQAGIIGSGCSSAAPAQHSTDFSLVSSKTEFLMHDGIQRRYRVRLPSGYKSSLKVPLVIVLHGGGGRGDNFDELMTAGTLSAAADSRKVLLVYPEGVRKQWNDGRPEILKGNRIYDDVGFISAVIDEVAQDYSIDLDRVYATGISNDGTDVEIQSVGNCREGVGVTLVKVTNGGHTWPGGNQYLRARRVGPVSRDINASEVILDFFLTHTR